ncbi:MAG TPA: hypothetical protein PLY41_07415 [Acetomicrobium sp.]|nr:hypothetical protein [Acetomicrobium sp.]
MDKTKKLSFKIPLETHRKLKILAAKEGKAMSEIICKLIEDYVEREGEYESK